MERIAYHCDNFERFPTSFLCLPNEILTKIIATMNQGDRQHVMSVNRRLHEVEFKTGHRRFTSVEIRSVSY